MGSVIMAAIMIVTMVTIVIVDLLRTIALRPRNEKLGNRSPKLHTSNVVHLVVNAAQILESPASLPTARMKSACVGNKYARISDRAAENVEWFEG